MTVTSPPTSVFGEYAPKAFPFGTPLRSTSTNRWRHPQ